jgi:hypothetical protein
MNETEKVLGIVLVADDQAAKVLQPGKEALDLPAALGAT